MAGCGDIGIGHRRHTLDSITRGASDEQRGGDGWQRGEEIYDTRSPCLWWCGRQEGEEEQRDATGEFCGRCSDRAPRAHGGSLIITCPGNASHFAASLALAQPERQAADWRRKRTLAAQREANNGYGWQSTERSSGRLLRGWWRSRKPGR